MRRGPGTASYMTNVFVHNISDIRDIHLDLFSQHFYCMNLVFLAVNALHSLTMFSLDEINLPRRGGFAEFRSNARNHRVSERNSWSFLHSDAISIPRRQVRC